MSTKIEAGDDVVAFLKTQHQEVKDLLEKVQEARGEERKTAFYEIRRLLAVHETAEEEIVHPVAKRVLPNGERIVEQRLEEENAAKKALTELEALDVDSPEFETQFATLKRNVIAHAESEENEEFEMLGRELDGERLQGMRKAAEIAESFAPTRPHAGVESAFANLIVGPFASMLDRARDALSHHH